MTATTQTAATTLAEVDAIAAEMREIDRKARHGEATKRDTARNNRINARRHQLIAPYGSYDALHVAVHGEIKPVVYAPAPADCPPTYRGYVYADHMERYADE